jgi:hypothetical protein
MKLSHILLATTLLAPSLASAQSSIFSGGEFALDYWSSDNDITQTQISAGLALSFGNAFGAQIGVKSTEYSGNNDASPAYELHLTYALSNGATLGLFVGAEEFGNTTYDYYGAEAAFEFSGVKAQAHFGNYSGGAYDAQHLGIDAEYDLARVSAPLTLMAGYHGASYNGGASDATYAYLGAGYRFGDNIMLSATYGCETDNIGSVGVAGLSLSYAFGNGVTFKQRNYSTLFPTF